MTLPLDVRINEGELIRSELDQMFTHVGFNSDIIRTHGALCVNAEEGREIAAVAAYKPSRIVAAEPDDGSERAEQNIRALAETTSHFNSTMLLKNDSETIKQFKDEGAQFGIVTNFNVFPKQIRYLYDFLNDAKEIVARRGIIIISVAENENGHFLEEIKNRGIKGLKLTIYKGHTKVSGSVTLIAKKE